MSYPNARILSFIFLILFYKEIVGIKYIPIVGFVFTGFP